MPYIFGKLWHLAIIWAIRKAFQGILQGVRFLLENHTRLSSTSENDSYIHKKQSLLIQKSIFLWMKKLLRSWCVLQLGVIHTINQPTSHLTSMSLCYGGKTCNMSHFIFYHLDYLGWPSTDLPRSVYLLCKQSESPIGASATRFQDSPAPVRSYHSDTGLDTLTWQLSKSFSDF